MFYSEQSYDVVLTQPNEEKVEDLISFFSYNIQGEELNYSEVVKQAFAIFKSVKHFIPFLLKSHIKVIVHFPAIRKLLIQR